MIDKLVLVLLTIALTSGCASKTDNELTALVTVGAPKHYGVWVELLELEASGVRHWRMPIGTVGCCWQGPDGPLGKGGRAEPFPDYIGIRWFSFAEQKFFERIFSLPDGLQEKMSEHASYTTAMGTYSRPRNILTIGVAPGGQMVLWIYNSADNELEVDRLQANEVEGDASKYAVRTEEYLEKHGDYIEKHGIPTEGW